MKAQQRSFIAAPAAAAAGFYRTAAGAEIDLVMEIPGSGLWAIEIKRGLSPALDKGFHIACMDLQPAHRFLVYSGCARYPHSPGLDAVSVAEMAALLRGIRAL